MIIRALFFTLIGMILCAGILSNSITITIYEQLQGEPVPGANPAGRLTIVILSLIVMALGFRAYRRQVRGESTSKIMRWAGLSVPYLVVIGTILGIWVGISEMRAHAKYNEDLATDFCSKTLQDETLIGSCLPDGLVCLREGREYDRQLPPNRRRMGRDVEMTCLRRRGTEKGWAMRPEETN
jgi:hypothetical protein